MTNAKLTQTEMHFETCQAARRRERELAEAAAVAEGSGLVSRYVFRLPSGKHASVIARDYHQAVMILFEELPTIGPSWDPATGACGMSFLVREEVTF